jgi:serine/threonine protein kinase
VLLGRLGSGGMGRVYLARSPGGRMVAVKVIRSALAEDPGFRHRFAREVAAARKVGGLFTAQVVDADVDGPVPWLVTAYVPGRPLSDAIDEQGPLPAPTVLALSAGLAEGLIAIHAAGVIHRDLKPSNVLLAQDGPRIIDFGISSAADATQLTGTGFMIGSPGFMSPEQAEGLTVGPASDIFSLACVITFAAKGEGPFGTGDTAALLYRIVHGKPNLDRLPDKLRPLIRRSLSREARKRPTAAQFLADLTSAYPSAADLTDWLPGGVLDPPGLRAGLPETSWPRQAPAGAPAAAGASAAGPADLMAAPAGMADAMAPPAEPGTSSNSAAPPPTMTTKTPTPPPSTQGTSQGYPAPQGYPGMSSGGASQPGDPSGGPQDNPWWNAQQQAGSTPQTPLPAQGVPGGYGPPPGTMGPPDQYYPTPAPAPRRKRPPWLVPAAVGAAVAGAVIAALVISLSPHSSNSNATRGTTSAGASQGGTPAAQSTPTVGDLQLSQLQVGDCLTGANMQLNKNTPWPKLTTAVPCASGHTAEVFYANNAYWPKNGPYPGNSAISKAGDTACNNAFAAYVGISYTKSIYTWTNIVPDATTWPTGDRGLHCVAYYATSSQPAGVTMHASIKNTRK